MKEPSREQRNEVETWFSFVATVNESYDTEEGRRRAIAARAYHVLGVFEAVDYRDLSAVLQDADASGSFVFLGRDIDEEAAVIERLDADGHEVALHGNRHVSWAELEYGAARDFLTRGFEAIVDATGVVPTGFFAPLKDVSPGTLRAASDLDLEWVLGRTDGEVPSGLTLVDTVYPHDNRLLERGMAPEGAFDQFRDEAVDGATFLYHPNMLEYHGAGGAFHDWIRDVSPTSVRAQLDGGGVGMVLDCVRPFKVS